jgi:endonuclease/exonuclease/phosphatase family metal-dependent hydrolase
VRIAEARQTIAEMDDHSVFAGDTNLRNAEWNAVAEWPTVTDAWEELGRPTDVRDTWQMHGHHARFDRVWLGDALHIVSMEAVGQVSAGRMPPSDHIGLLIEIEVRLAPADR